MAEQQWWIRLVLACTSLSVALSCSCVDGSWNRHRDDAITDDFKSSADVYAGVVTAADCRCFPQGNTSTRLDCLSYRLNQDSTVVERVGERYVCSSEGGFVSYSFSDCDTLRTTLVSSRTVVPVPDLPPITNVTEEEECGVSELTGEGCELSYQPCFYNVTVTTVYKGTMATGDVVVTSGPDVLTSCGAYGRILTLGVEYVVGIGGACNPINEWSSLESYSESEVALLEDLQQQCAEDPSTCNGVRGTHLIHVLFLSLVIVITILIY